MRPDASAAKGRWTGTAGPLLAEAEEWTKPSGADRFPKTHPQGSHPAGWQIRPPALSSRHGQLNRYAFEIGSEARLPGVQRDGKGAHSKVTFSGVTVFAPKPSSAPDAAAQTGTVSADRQYPDHASSTSRRLRNASLRR